MRSDLSRAFLFVSIHKVCVTYQALTLDHSLVYMGEMLVFIVPLSNMRFVCDMNEQTLYKQECFEERQTDRQLPLSAAVI